MLLHVYYVDFVISSRFSLFSGVEIGLVETDYVVVENNGMLEVCAQITGGTLERQVTVTLTGMEGSATSTGM